MSDWPDRIWLATSAGGVLCADHFTASGDGPVYVQVNDGLPSLAISSFCLDRSANPIDARMFALVGGTIYRRTTGAWEAVLTSAEARALLGYSHDETLKSLTTDQVTGWVYAYIEGSNLPLGCVRSDDHGETWQAFPIRGTGWTYGLGNIDAHNGIVAFGDVSGSMNARVWYSVNHGATWSYWGLPSLSVPPMVTHMDRYSGNAQWYGAFWNTTHLLGYNELYRGTPSGITQIAYGSGWGPYHAGGFWIDPDDPAHMLSLHTSNNIAMQAVETFDGWATATKTNVSASYVDVVAEHSKSNAWVMSSESGHVFVTTDGYTVVDRCGNAHDISHGAIIGCGLWAVFDPPTGGPTPPGGGTITPPDETGPITLGGDALVQAVTMPDYTGVDRGEPMPGDRGAWDTVDYASLHARDIQDAAPTVHNPTDGNVGDVPMWDGEKYVATDVLTPAEHTAIGNDAPHHAPVTLGAGNDAEMASLVGQELTVALKDHAHDGSAGEGGQIEGSNILSTGAAIDYVLTADGLGHSAWAAPIEPPGIQYRQFIYVPDGAGSWAFVVDEDGMPVLGLFNTE